MLLLNIVICDDMPILREYLEMLIHLYEEENGTQFNLYQFDSGEELLDKFDEHKICFDLIFMDYYMKKLTGVETAMHIRHHDTACNIVFLTSSDSRYEFMSVKPLQILSKPVQKEDVYKILNKVLVDKS